MAEDKKPVSMSDLIAAQTLFGITGKENEGDDSLLRDMVGDYDALRLHLLGCTLEGMKVAPGTLRVQRSPCGIRLVVHKPLLGYQASFEGDSWYGVLETAETAVQHGHQCWQPDYQQQQKEKKRYLD